jgi:xanthine dehydrogenase accessory factor
MNAELDELFDRIAAWRQAGKRIALATVIGTWGSSPRPAGSHLAADEAGEFVGSVSGGCVEPAVIGEARSVIADGIPRRLEFGVSDEQAWEVGLACGGHIEVFVECLDSDPVVVDRIQAARSENRPIAVVTRVRDGARMTWEANRADGALALDDARIAEVRSMLAAGRSGLLAGEGERLFVRSYASAPRLMIVGAVHIGQALAAMAAMTGFDVTVIDPRRAFAAADRFPGVRLNGEWPDEALDRLGIDEATAVVTLTHDPKLDDPALAAALASPAFYIGALGSRRTHAKRLERLAQAGLSEASARIHAPVGLDLGGRAPAEIAVAILAQIIQARYRSQPT